MGMVGMGNTHSVPRRSKYRAVPTMLDGERFASKAEASRWAGLLLLQKAGAITGLQRQVRYPLAIGNTPILIRSKGFPKGRQAHYTADFVYCEHGLVVVEEFKGFDTTESRLRRAVFEAMHGCIIRVTGKAHEIPLRGSVSGVAA